MKMWVIGNGFDLALGLRTRFNDFRSFLKREGPAFYQGLSALFDNDEDWSEFEEKLAHPSDALLKQIEGIERAYGKEHSLFDKNWWFELANYLQKWLRLAETPITDIGPELIQVLPLMKKDDLYVNFNLTLSIERLLEVPSENVIHLHGNVFSERESASNLEPSVVFGHKPVLEQDLALKDSRCRRFVSITEKPTGRVIEKLRSSLHRNFSPDAIYVYGFGWGEVDWPYINELLRQSFKESNFVDKRIPWVIYCHNIEGILKAQKYFLNIGFSNSSPVIVHGHEKINLLEI